MRKHYLAAVALLLSSWCNAEILTIYSDSGLASNVGYNDFNSVDTRDGAYVPSLLEGAAPEGNTSWKVTKAGSGSYAYIFFFTSPQNLSRFSSGQTTGELRAWLNVSRIDVTIDVKDAIGSQASSTLSSAGWTAADIGHWKLLRIPLAHKSLGAITVPFALSGTADATAPTSILVDNVRFVDTTAASIFNVSVLNNATNLPDAISWNASAPSGWVASNQHLQLALDSDVSSWGVQIYTDNVASGANPQWAGPNSSNPAGLVDTTLHTRVIPLAWSIKDLTVAAPIAADPNNAGDSNSFQWLFMKDKSTPANPETNTTAFVNGDQDPYVVVKSNKGIHFGGAPTEFGANNPPNNIYLEANFTNAATPLTYNTNQLVIEYFTP